MRRRCVWLTVLAVWGAVWCVYTPARAQTVIDGRTALDNVESAGARAPGNMVSAGLGRAQTAVQDPFVPVEITETSRSNPVRVQALVDAVGIIFDFVEQMLLFLGNRLAARAGWMDLLPLETFFPPTDSGTTDGSSGSTDTTGGDSTDTGGVRPGRSGGK